MGDPLVDPGLLCDGAAGAARKKWDAGDLEGAAALYHSALVNAEQLGPDDPRLASTLCSLASVYIDLGKATEATEYAARALGAAEKFGDKGRRVIAAACMILGGTALAAKRLKEAKRFYKRAIPIFQALGTIEFVMTLFNFAMVYKEEGKHERAIELCRQALTALKKMGKAEGPEFANVLHGLACAYHGAKKPAEAEPVFKWAIALLEKTLGPSAPPLAEVLADYAALLGEIGRGPEATKLAARAAKIRDARPVADAAAKLKDVQGGA